MEWTRGEARSRHPWFRTVALPVTPAGTAGRGSACPGLTSQLQNGAPTARAVIAQVALCELEKGIPGALWALVSCMRAGFQPLPVSKAALLLKDLPQRVGAEG